VVRGVVNALGRPVDRVLRPVEQGVVVFIYHRVGARTPSPVDLAVDTFTAQLDHLAERFSVVSLDDACHWLASGTRPATATRAMAVLTFDDGTADWPDLVLPLLAERGWPATFYVSTDYVETGRDFPDEGRPVSWAGLAELRDSGLATLESHTHSHQVLAGVDRQQAVYEIDRSIQLIGERLGVAPRHFAYPRAVPPDPAAEVVVRRRFATAALAGNRANRVGADLHRLGRHAVTRGDTLDAFARKAAGGMLLEGWLRERRSVLRN
jgi:peptidoglycan/xylan/chitin deacetylase (PgdA/CDA1 family)